MKARPTICHIVNFFRPAGSLLLPFEQRVTLASMLVARRFAAPDTEVHLLAATFPEDAGVVDEEDVQTVTLDRSSEELGRFAVHRKLPLIREIVARGAEQLDADVLVYTNSDIALMPHFYRHVSDYFASGGDGLVINRRTIHTDWSSIDDLPRMYSEIGCDHPGHDCFCLPMAAAQHFYCGDTMVGANHLGKVLFANVFVRATRLTVLQHHHLTFHLGDDRAWSASRFRDYDWYNERECRRVLETLENEHGPFGRCELPGLFYLHLTRSRLVRGLMRLACTLGLRR